MGRFGDELIGQPLVRCTRLEYDEAAWHLSLDFVGDADHCALRDGRVRLGGQVRSGFQRQAAEWAVSGVDGVLWLENLIAISPEPIPSDIADRINKAFKRSAIIDDSKIVVSHEGHTISLTGVVGSYAALREALDTAWNAPGVEMVENHLLVEP